TVDLGRDTDEPSLEARGLERGGTDRAASWRTECLRQHFRHSLPAATLGAWFRRCGAFNDEVPQRAFGCDRWSRGCACRGGTAGAARLFAERCGGRTWPVRLIPDSAWNQDPRVAHGATLFQRYGDRRIPRASPEG